MLESTFFSLSEQPVQVITKQNSYSFLRCNAQFDVNKNKILRIHPVIRDPIENLNIDNFVDYNITTIEEILLARAWAEKQEAVEEQTLISRTLESWVGDEMHACGTNQQSLWMIFDTKFPDFEG